MTLAVERQVGTNDTAGARRIHAAFARARAEGRPALMPYLVAGYPDAETSLAAALAAADAGADLLEVGLPYSDPLADGATVQRASAAALQAGSTLERALALIERIGKERPELVLLPMAYANLDLIDILACSRGCVRDATTSPAISSSAVKSSA